MVTRWCWPRRCRSNFCLARLHAAPGRRPASRPSRRRRRRPASLGLHRRPPMLALFSHPRDDILLIHRADELNGQHRSKNRHHGSRAAARSSSLANRAMCFPPPFPLVARIGSHDVFADDLMRATAVASVGADHTYLVAGHREHDALRGIGAYHPCSNATQSCGIGDRRDW